MLSFDKGNIIGYFDGDKKSSLYHEKLYIYQPKKIDEKPHIITVDKNELIKYYVDHLPKLSYSEKKLLIKSIQTKTIPSLPKLEEYYVNAKGKIEDLEKKQLSVPDDDNSKFEVLPDLKKHNTLTVFGKSGSGKSYFVSQWCKEARKQNPKIPIYLISRVDEDEAFDKGFEPKIKRVTIDDEIVSQPLEPTDFPEGSIIICDDYAMIADLKRRKSIKDFVNKVLETGRHYKLTAICIFHKALGGRDTMALHSESTLTVLFPRANENECEKYLKNYMSFNKDQLDLVKDISKKSRWVAITNDYPTVLMCEKLIKIL